MKRILATLFFAVSYIFASFSQQHFVGMDLSMLPQYEKYNKPYLDKDGAEIQDMLTWLPSLGVNTIRVRLFVEPKESNPDKPEGVCQDLEYVKSFGARIKAAGHFFMLDLHYSDTWADPSKQYLPDSWKDCTTTEKKAERVYSYTKEVLEALNAAGATPDFVQVGNEITYGMIGIKVYPYDSDKSDWAGFLNVLEQGCKAVREQCPAAKIIIHTERSGKADQTSYYYKKLASLDYDVIGLSYYPFWHGYLAALETTLNILAKDFPEKEIQIVETAYYNNWFPNDATYKTTGTWAASEDGQKKFIEDLIATLNKHENVNGINYWFPEEAGNGDKGKVIGSWLNRGLWWPTADAKGHWPLKGLYSLVGYSSALENIIGDRPVDSQRYNLAGQKITEPTQGEVFIQEGKKYLAK